MKKIGILTFCNCMNYGAELQAYALQKVLSNMGFDSEVIHVEKETGMMDSSMRTIFNAIANRYKYYGLIKGTAKVISLVNSTFAVRKSESKNIKLREQKKSIFDDFFNNCVVHSKDYYTLDELSIIDKMPYDAIVAGSDQIWNYMQTRHLNIFFLEFAHRLGLRCISYAASFSVESIPSDLKSTYAKYLENLDYISVREDSGVDIIKDCAGKKAEHVLDPTLLIDSKTWVNSIGNDSYLPKGKKYIVIYTLSGSTYIYKLAKNIAERLGLDILNIRDGYEKVKGDEGIQHLYDVGPKEFISIFNQAAYVITDSFHGTAFSVNFNIPFTTLLNPVSNMNGRVKSLLRLTGLIESRVIYDDGNDRIPTELNVDFSEVNRIIDAQRLHSIDYLKTALELQ